MPKLSLCLLARNEEANIGRALRSFHGVADEIIVADTGSSDRTMQIAEELGAQVFDFAWQDDFAAVRNFIFDQATGEWIFHLDCDEELRPESKSELTALLKRTQVQGALVLREDIAETSHPEIFTEMWQLRLFRKEALPPQVGRCHPHFVPRLEDVASAHGRTIVSSQVRIRHWGYVDELRREKLERGARLLRLELADRPGQLYYLSELVRTLYSLNDPSAPEVLEEAANRLGQSEEPGVSALGILETLLQLPVASLPSSWQEERIESFTLKWFPTSIPLRWQLARKGFLRNDFEAAREHLEAIWQLKETGDYDRTISFSPAILGEELTLNLGVCRFRCGDLDGAEACFLQIAPDSDFRPAALQNLVSVRAIRAKTGNSQESQ